MMTLAVDAPIFQGSLITARGRVSKTSRSRQSHAEQPGARVAEFPGCKQGGLSLITTSRESSISSLCGGVHRLQSVRSSHYWRRHQRFWQGRRSINASLGSAEGDSGVQRVLVDMIRLEIGRVRMTEFVDERSQHMRDIANGHTIELNRIARQAMKRVDGFGTRVLREFDASTNAIERDLELARVELEATERDFEEFEARALYSRNEGLFFKSLYPRPKSLPYRKMQARVVPRVKVQVDVTTENSDRASSAYRYVLYSGLSLVLLSLAWSSSSAFLAGAGMKSSKLAAYVVIISLLLLQIKFEKAILGQEEQADGGAGDN